MLVSGFFELTVSGTRIGLYAALAIGLVVLVAWVDGGEEPLREIVQSVPLPEDAL